MDPRYKIGMGARTNRPHGQSLEMSDLSLDDDYDTDSSGAESEDYADVYSSVDKQLSQQWPADYWGIIKLAKYLRHGTPTLTAMALHYIHDCDFNNPITMQALKDNNGVNVIINLLDCRDRRVQITALRCLRKLAELKTIRYEIVYYGGLQSIIDLLRKPHMELRKEALMVIEVVAVFHRAWKIVRSCRGVLLLTHLLHVPTKILNQAPSELTSVQQEFVSIAVHAAKALYRLCEDKKIKKIFWRCGGFRECSKIVKCKHIALLVSVLHLLQQCAVKKYFRDGMRACDMLTDLRNHLFSRDHRIMQIAAQTVFRCAADIESRETFGEKGYLSRIVEIVNTAEYHRNFVLMASMTGALWKCAKSISNVKRLQTLNAVQTINQLLATQPLQVQVHIVGCIAHCIRIPQICVVARKNGAIDAMIGLLQTTHPPLIKNLNNALAEASKDVECMNILEKLDAIKLIWSHLKNKDLSVVSNTAWNLHTIIRNIKESVLYVRTLLGGLELIEKNLLSKYTAVTTPICAVIVSLTKEPENIGILTDFHVVEHLSNLTQTKCKKLRYFLCLAIAGCCPFRDNRKEFGERGIVWPLLKFMKSKYPEIRGSACQALYQMSMIPKWCVVIHREKGILEIVLEQLDSKDPLVQNCAAGALQGLRYFSLVRDRNVPDFIEERLVRKSRCLM